MSPSRQNKIALVCWANVASTFAMMHNPKYRGPTFRWENFGEMAEGHIASTVIAMTDVEKTEEEFVKKTCRDIGEQLVRRFQG